MSVKPQPQKKGGGTAGVEIEDSSSHSHKGPKPDCPICQSKIAETKLRIEQLKNKIFSLIQKDPDFFSKKTNTVIVGWINKK